LKIAIAVCLALLVLAAALFLRNYRQAEGLEEARALRGEMQVTVTNISQTHCEFYRSGKKLADATRLQFENLTDFWLPPGNYFLAAKQQSHITYYPITTLGYNSGPEDGKFTVTVRSYPSESPEGRFSYIPAGYFLLGDRLNASEPHYVWLQGFWIGIFEVTNNEFREFLNDPHGYSDDSNWTTAGKKWTHANASHCSALLQSDDSEFTRFGKDDNAVVDLKWFEANAYCKWLTRKSGRGSWIFALPSEAEWEKAGRGPDGLDYGLSSTISDSEVGMYNWKKNPGAPITVVGTSLSWQFKANRFGIYHMSGNVSEWTQSEFIPYNREHPYDEYARNRDDSTDQRVVRGGSWYSASTALLYLAYRDAFTPEHSSMERGFRIVARRIPD
jgi:formylglycine-generating enzyme required for sulfatase activity